MNILGKDLRDLIVNNRFENNRLSRKDLGNEDYNELTKLYRNAEDALTEWASADYNHKTTKEHIDNAFNAVKAILLIYQTDDSRIIIDEVSMRSIRDMATQPKRIYSKEYTKAMKELKAQQKSVDKNYEILKELGNDMPTENQDFDAWVEEVLANKKYMLYGTTNMVDMLKMSMVHLDKCNKDIEDIKKAGKWSWRRAVPVSENIFADLIENYVGDCLEDGYNIKTSKNIRDEKAEARKLALEAKKANA